MSGKSAIEWTDATWNPTTGCDRVSPGCAHCYAKTLHDKRHQAFLNGWSAAPAQYHQPFEVVQTHSDRVEAPLHWRAPRMVFVDSVSDLFYGNEADRKRCEAQGIPFHPVPFEFIDSVFAVMAFTSQHTYQILTKRADRALEYFTGETRNGCSRQAFVAKAAAAVRVSERFARSYALSADQAVAVWPLPNVWIGTSVENQHFADARIPLLLKTPAAIRFVSCEPLLGPITFKQQNPDGFWPPNAAQPDLAWLRHKDWPDDFQYWSTGVNWVIVGGESGRGARPFELGWARAIVKQCRKAKVPVFVKQLGANPFDWDHAEPTGRFRTNPETGRRQMELKVDVIVRHPKGGDPAEWPADLRVREFPPAWRA